MIRHIITVALISLFLPFAQAAAQEPPPTSLVQQLQTLQGRLGEWQQTLSGFDFDTLGLGAAWLDRLSMDRSSCLEIMKRDGDIASKLASEKPPKFTLEILLLLNLNKTEDCLFKIHDFLNLASMEMHPAEKESQSRSGRPMTSLRWQGQIGSWVNQLHPPELEADIDRWEAKVDGQN